ncbi:MAG TPA: hypothetical protein DD811_03755 [Syntrophomonas sp.]|nr:hypothetical protein [Syntrophomonas sp.]
MHEYFLPKQLAAIGYLAAFDTTNNQKGRFILLYKERNRPPVFLVSMGLYIMHSIPIGLIYFKWNL